MESNLSLENGSIPVFEIGNVEKLLKSKYWLKYLLKYSEENKIETNVYLLKRICEYRETGCLDYEFAKDIYINLMKLEELIEESEMLKLKERLDKKAPEEQLENTLFDEVYTKIYEDFQQNHWLNFQDYAMKEDEKIHLQDAVQIINMIDVDENDKKEDVDPKIENNPTIDENGTIGQNGKKDRSEILLLEYQRCESKYSENKLNLDFFKEWSKVCIKLFKKGKLKFKEVKKVIEEGLSIKPKDTYLQRKKGVAYSKESSNLLKKMAEENKNVKKKLNVECIKETGKNTHEKMEFDLLFREAIHCFESVQKDEKTQKLYENWGHLYFSRAHCCDILEEQKKAIDCYFESIKYFEKAFLLDKRCEKAIYNWGKSIDRICSYKLSSTEQKELSLTLTKYLKFFASFIRKSKKANLKPLIALVYSDQDIVQKANPIDALWKIAKTSKEFSVRLEATKQVLYVGNLLRKIPQDLEDFFKYSKLPMENTLGHVNILVSVVDWYMSHILKKKTELSSDEERDEKDKKNEGENSKEDVLKKFESKINNLFIQENPSKYYKMETTIGSGGFGTVWTALELSKEQIEHANKWSFRSLLASRNSSSTTVAIKVFSRNLVDDCAHIIKEIEIMRSCSHEHIVKYIKSFLYSGKAYVVMEYCDGGSLNDMERQVVFTESEIAYVVSRVLSGLAYLHSKELVHRDIKPDNLLFNIDGSVRIGDLGLVTSEKLAMSNKQICGTYYYMSPEQIAKSGYSSKTDIWSLGITTREMMERDPPYSNKNKIYAMYYTAVKGVEPVKEPQKWSSSLIDFLDRCLSKDPAKRETAKNLMQHNFLNTQCTRGRMKQLCELTFLGNALNMMGL